MFKSLPEATAAVDGGKVVCWKNDQYLLQPDLFGQWQVVFKPWSIKKMNVANLYHTDGISSDYDPSDFFVKERNA